MRKPTIRDIPFIFNKHPLEKRGVLKSWDTGVSGFIEHPDVGSYIFTFTVDPPSDTQPTQRSRYAKSNG